LAYWYRNAPLLLPEEVWRLELQLKPPWGRINFQGADREQWLFAEKIGGLATVKSGERIAAASSRLSNWNASRHYVRTQLARFIGDQDNRAVVAALAIADRSGLSLRQRNILSQTGTAHLLAISGLHIGLSAVFGFWLARVFLSLWPLRWTGGLIWPASQLTGLALALAYAALAGFGTSTIRAMAMLAAGVLALLLRRTIHPGQALLIALSLILLFDPLAFLSAGLWLSFAAVGVLLLLFSKGHAGQLAWWRQMLRAQTGIMLVLLPLSAWWFQSASVVGLLANLLAIPFVSAVVVPLILLGLLTLPLCAALAAMTFSAAAVCVGWLFRALSALAGLPLSFLALPQPPLWASVLATLGALLLLLPHGLHHRWLGAVLLLPLFAPQLPPQSGRMQMDVLDVGQGTAVLVSSSNHLLLYDSGPGNGKDFDLADSVIRPAIRASGHSGPDLIIISHADLDHSGALRSLVGYYPQAGVLASFPEPANGVMSCVDTWRWNWDGLAFEILHPSPWLPYLGNDSSCVLSISTDTVSILLPGDIAEAAEQRLLHLRRLKNTDILLVPHHGSRLSSTPGFLHAVRPRIAIATAGLGNRFGFPRPEVIHRYRDAGIPLWSTDGCGAVRLLISENGDIQASSARRARPAPWRWPVGELCP